MNGLIVLFESEFCANLTTALLHTLWQGALVAAALYLFLRGRPAEQAGKRYIVSLVALGAIVVAGFITWALLDYEPQARGKTSAAYSPDQAKAAPDGGIERASGELAGPADFERAEAAPASRRFNWCLWAMGGWLAGAAVMLLRALLVMVGLGRLRLACRPLEDEAVLAVIEQLQAGMRIARRIRVVVAERILVPGVIGFFRPTLLVPVSMLSGVTPDDLRAVLAHELAHIRRFDYLVNFCQMVIEAVLFFNPAVWWISRQIRIEREACCDRAAVAATGRRVRYAEVLARWARMVKRADIGVAAAAIVGFVEEGQSGTVLDRVKRIVVAGHRPRLHVSWYVAAAMMALSLAVLVGLWRGTKLTVAFAGRLLTPQERVEMIAEINKTHGMVDRQYGEEDKILLSGVVRTLDGRPLTKNASMKVRWERPRHSGTAEIQVGAWDRFDESGVFSYRAEYGSIILLASDEGYAPAFAGPFEAEPGGSVSDIEIVLTDGFEGRIKVADDQDNPVAGARFTGGYVYPGGSWHHNIKLTTDEAGLATIQHAASWDLAFQISADGFEFERINRIKLRPDEVTILHLTKAMGTTGVVLSEKTGEPVAGAEIRLLISKGPAGTFFSGGQPEGPPDAAADESGRFELNTLRGESRYLAMVGAPGFGNRFLTNLRAGQSDLEVLLGEKKRIKGRVIGDLDRLEKASGAPIVRYVNKYGFEDHSNSSGWATCPVEIQDGIGYFEIDDCWGQSVNIWVDRERFSVDVEKDPLDDVVVDLRPLQARQDVRQVVLKFDVPEGSPGVQGCVRVDYISEVSRARKLGMTPKWLDIEEGRAACEIPVPGKFKYGIDYHQGRRPVGYWFEEISPIDVEPSDEPLVIDVPLRPAGALYGRILRPDGTAAEEARASLSVVQKPAGIERTSDLVNSLGGNERKRGTFSASPLPLGGKYAVIAHLDDSWAVSEDVMLDEVNPIRQMEIRLAEGVNVAGRLVYDDGAPARKMVWLNLSMKRGRSSWSSGGKKVRPDEEGRFVFEGVNPDIPGYYSIEAEPGPGYRPVRRRLDDLGKPVLIELEEGLLAAGVVIDDATGWPVPGVGLWAFWIEDKNGKLRTERLEPEAKTNENGEFVFSNMADRKYRLHVLARLADPRDEVFITGGQAEPVVVRINIPERSRLKPRKPQNAAE